jgi:Holliday junction resolvasome RuvABC endonuclease subunit
MDYKIFSLDISSVSTGWSFLINNVIKDYGKIIIKKGLDKSEKLLIFRKDIIDLLVIHKPDNIVIENGFFGMNVSTLKTLSNFSGVAIECCLSTTGIKPYIMSNKTPKAHFGVKTKQELFDKIVKQYKLDDFEFEDHNDITDSIAQGICYYKTILKGTWG